MHSRVQTLVVRVLPQRARWPIMYSAHQEIVALGRGNSANSSVVYTAGSVRRYDAYLGKEVRAHRLQWALDRQVLQHLHRSHLYGVEAGFHDALKVKFCVC